MREPIHSGRERLPFSWISRRNCPLPLGSTHRSPAVPPRYRFQRAGSRALRPMTQPPFGPNEIDWAGPVGNNSGAPPSSPMVHRRGGAPKGCCALLLKMILPESVHPTTSVFAPKYVSLRASPPSAGITYTSRLPSSRPLNASHAPSRESAGWLTEPRPEVSRRAIPPPAETVHRSSSLTNTTVLS